MQMIQTIAPLILTPLMGVITWLLTRVLEERRTSSSGMKLLLKAELKELHKQHMENGKITSEDVAEFNEIYETYHNLKGNGLGTIWKEDIDKLERIGE